MRTYTFTNMSIQPLDNVKLASTEVVIEKGNRGYRGVDGKFIPETTRVLNVRGDSLVTVSDNDDDNEPVNRKNPVKGFELRHVLSSEWSINPETGVVTIPDFKKGPRASKFVAMDTATVTDFLTGIVAATEPTTNSDTSRKGK